VVHTHVVNVARGTAVVYTAINVATAIVAAFPNCTVIVVVVMDGMDGTPIFREDG
jgi:hypothetical protein